MKTRSKQWLTAGVGLLVVVGSLVGVKAGQIGLMIASGKTFSPPPESVTSALVQAASGSPPSRPPAAWWRCTA